MTPFSAIRDVCSKKLSSQAGVVVVFLCDTSLVLTRFSPGTLPKALGLMTQSHGITQLLIQWNEGDETALDQLMPLVERELRRLARNFMRKENPGHTLQPTALVNETYLKLVDQKRAQWQNRAHFFAIAAQIMRRILLDHAKKRNRAKRGGHMQQVSISDRLAVSNKKSEELIALDEALVRLSAVDPLMSKITELRYFGGLGVEEVAEVLRIAPITVMRHWKLARAWLRREIDSGSQS
jgi:RNA polymerase sigma-70 factor (ECF subfamily)